MVEAVAHGSEGEVFLTMVTSDSFVMGVEVRFLSKLSPPLVLSTPTFSSDAH
jgi:hypothetical protein